MRQIDGHVCTVHGQAVTNSALLLANVHVHVTMPIDSAYSMHNACHCVFCSCAQPSSQEYDWYKDRRK